MAINFPNSPSNGATHTAAGQTFTYDGTAGVWNPPTAGNAAITTDGSTPSLASGITGAEVRTLIGAGESAARTAVYANIAALPTSGTAGDMAYVTATNRLYLWTGTGWYNIALINNNPTISGVSATYDLAIDGTATTVTMTATDPEGLPITYSIVSDTSGNAATVAQGTGSSTNVFTITPSTNTAHAGTFSLTFRASDGVNIASAAASFTLEFKVVNQKYTTALITSVGANNAVNNSFDDKSTNDHTITVNGDAHQTTFSPYRHGGYSTYFDGTTDYLTVTDSAEHEFGTGDFSMEFWWWPETVTGNSGNIHIMISAPNNGSNQFIYHESNYWYYQSGGGGATVIPSSTGAVTAKAWNHVVLCRSGTTMSIFNNGTRTGTVQSSATVDFSNATIGRYHSAGYEVDGYVRDMRWLKGSSAYDATQTSITLPTEPLTAVTNTTFLACHLPYIADGSTTGHSIAVNGNTKTEPFAPYDAQEYSATDHGGSAYFDGTGDYLSVADGSWITLGSSDFTIECWAYNTVTSGSRQDLFGQGNSAGQAFSISTELYINSNRTVGGGVYVGSQAYLTSTATVPVNTWNHIVLARDGTTMRLYINGVQSATTSVGSGTVSDQSTDFSIGRVGEYNGLYFNGNISDFRFVKGTCVYPSGTTFTPPTAPLTAITNTSLLLQGTDAGIIDKSQTTKKVQLFADTKSSTAQYKFLSSSIYFDGTGDYLKTSSSGNFLAEGPWTQEMWLRLAGTGAGQQIGPAFGGGFGGWNSSTGHQWLLYTHSSGFLVQYYGTNNSHNTITIASSAPFTANTWHHWAISWDGTTLRFFMDGTSVHTTTSFTPNTMTATHTELGRMPDNSYYSQAYYSDVRITKGLARYTSNFTAPTAALQG